MCLRWTLSCCLTTASPIFSSFWDDPYWVAEASAGPWSWNSWPWPQTWLSTCFPDNSSLIRRPQAEHRLQRLSLCPFATSSASSSPRGWHSCTRGPSLWPHLLKGSSAWGEATLATAIMKIHKFRSFWKCLWRAKPPCLWPGVNRLAWTEKIYLYSSSLTKMRSLTAPCKHFWPSLVHCACCLILWQFLEQRTCLVQVFWMNKMNPEKSGLRDAKKLHHHYIAIQHIYILHGKPKFLYTVTDS